MTDMKISKAEAERLIVDAVTQGWNAARNYPTAVSMSVSIEWRKRFRFDQPLITIHMFEEGAE